MKKKKFDPGESYLSLLLSEVEDLFQSFLTTEIPKLTECGVDRIQNKFLDLISEIIAADESVGVRHGYYLEWKRKKTALDIDMEEIFSKMRGKK